MKVYDVYLSDAPNDAMRCIAETKAQARIFGRRYIKEWNLSAVVLNVEEVKGVTPEDFKNRKE